METLELVYMSTGFPWPSSEYYDPVALNRAIFSRRIGGAVGRPSAVRLMRASGLQSVPRSLGGGSWRQTYGAGTGPHALWHVRRAYRVPQLIRAQRQNEFNMGFPGVAPKHIQLGGTSKRTAIPTSSSETGGYSAITRGSCPAIMCADESANSCSRA